MKKTSKQSYVLIIALCWAAYTVAYIGRLNLNAYIEPIRDQLGASKTELGLVSSFFFFSYGAGQLVHGILSRKYNTRYSVAFALFGSAAVNVLMTFCPGAGEMKYVWFLNGVCQSALWSSVIKTLADRLSDEALPRAVVVISTPPALGTFLAYGLAALLSSLGADYKAVFYIPAVLMALAGAAWFILLGRADEKKESVYAPIEKKKLTLTPAFIFGAAAVCLIAVSNGFIKDGVTTWTPSILIENYGLRKSLSILITVILPLLAILGSWFSTLLHKFQKNTSVLNGGLYIAETAVLLSVMLTAKNEAGSPALTVVLFGASAMLMSAVNNVITSIIPLYMREKTESGMLAGVLDTFCYVGSALSTGLLGYIADKSSWNGVFLCLFIFGAAAFILCVLSAPCVKKIKE